MLRCNELFRTSDTSRPRKPGEVDGIHYWFVSKTQFQEDVTAHKFVEWGEFQKHFYGTSFDAIRNVVERGKTCVLNLRAPVGLGNEPVAHTMYIIQSRFFSL